MSVYVCLQATMLVIRHERRRAVSDTRMAGGCVGGCAVISGLADAAGPCGGVLRVQGCHVMVQMTAVL